MPYKSDKQRRWAHTDSAKKAGFPTAEFDKASKGMADGGEVKGDDFMEQEKEGFKNGINGDWDQLKAALHGYADKLHTNYIKAQNGDGDLKGLHDLMAQHQQDQTPNMADGGDITSAVTGALGQAFSPFMAPHLAQASADTANDMPTINPLENMAENLAVNRLNSQIQPQPAPAQITPIAPTPPQPQAPDLSMAASNATNMPPTNYNPNQGITAEDRAALYKQLLARKSSPGQLVASGAAGLGDAISNSFGKGGSNFQKQVDENLDKNTEAQISGVDTERQQRLQDQQAKVEMQMNDPNSPISRSMQKTLRASGVNVPSGMSGALMLKVAGPLAEMAKARATVAETHFGHELGAATKEEALQESREKMKADHPIQSFFGMLPGQATSHPSGAKITRIN